MSTVLLRHPRIHLGPDGSAPVTGLLVRDGRVLAAGESGDLSRAEPDQVLDLPGVAVVPGLIDAHIHSLSYARGLGEVDLRTAASLADCLERIGRHSAGLDRDAWLTGGHWDANRWQVPTQPDRYALDSVTGGRPAVLDSLDGHTIWANSAALSLAGIDAHTPDPAGGQIVRDPDGDATGILRERAGALATAARPADSRDRVTAMLAAGQHRLLALGLTAIHDLDGEDAREGYRTLHEQGELVLRVMKSVPHGALQRAVDEGRRTGVGDERLWTGPVKLFSDGALGSRTCHMCAPFADTGTTGMAVMSRELLWQATRLALSHGIGVATHAIGDRANEIVLSVYEEAARRGLRPPGAPRVSIEHAQYLRPGDSRRLAALDVIASMQPTHCTTDWDLADQVLVGHDLLPYAWRSVLTGGGLLAFGSDAPIEDPNPLLALHAAVTRRRLDGTPGDGWRSDEAITAGQALVAHTAGSAHALGRERELGALRPGFRADLVCLDVDPLSALPAAGAVDRAAAVAAQDALAHGTVLSTWSAGEQVYAATTC